MKYVLTCPYNTTQIAKKELEILWYKATITSQTSLHFDGDDATIARVNLNSRIGNKLFLQLAIGRVQNFEDLFWVVSSVDRAKFITPGQSILINALSKMNALTSVPAIQWMTKKAITKKLLGNDERREENNELQAVDVMITLDRDTCYVLLNTTGESLHERGYRQHAGEAPIKENLAAALILSSGRKFSTPLVDPFCGAWTIAIEAALIAKNIAPWLIRPFAFHGFERYAPSHYVEAKATAEAKVMLNKQHTIIGHDIDPTMIEISKDNAKNAWLADHIQFSTRDFVTSPIVPELPADKPQRSLLTNPPYGERMQLAEIMPLYQRLLSLFEDNKHVNGGFITNAPAVPQLYQPSYWKETKYYNGPIECTFYKIARL